jgi:hypothetical protein
MQALIDQFARFIAELTYQARTLEPGGWLLLGVGMAVVFVFLVRPPR